MTSTTKISVVLKIGRALGLGGIFSLSQSQTVEAGYLMRSQSRHYQQYNDTIITGNKTLFVTHSSLY